ncbi:peptidoglycan-binding domain-containing protein [Acrocarpospora catenulata]|uniref:peptidoglycan-binding domain-containing protein n=1 Tax=Acrocarpospora catenulata TaxID=2836182 RepID=UPI001BDACE40|nr:peptidoglycan-binding domain-containing protein [Acrocarpospora catenulata]
MGDVDPIDGKDCVRLLQRALRDNGFPGQRLNGRFGPQTHANVKAYQGDHGLLRDGKVGRQTRAALTGGATPTISMRLDLGLPVCADGVCVFSMRRGLTRQVGGRLAANPRLVNEMVTSLLAYGVCGAARIKAVIARIGCEQVVGKVIGDFADALETAAARNACVRISAGLRADGTSLRFLRFTPDSSARCQN